MWCNSRKSTCSESQEEVIRNHSALNAPNVLLDSNTQLVDWSGNDTIGIALENVVYLHNPFDNESEML